MMRTMLGDIDLDGADPWLAEAIRECAARDPQSRPTLADVIARCRTKLATARTRPATAPPEPAAVEARPAAAPRTLARAWIIAGVATAVTLVATAGTIVYYRHDAKSSLAAVASDAPYVAAPLGLPSPTAPTAAGTPSHSSPPPAASPPRAAPAPPPSSQASTSPPRTKTTVKAKAPAGPDGTWHPVAGTWKKSGSGAKGSNPESDAFFLNSDVGADFTYAADVRLDEGIAVALTFRATDDATSHYTATLDAKDQVVKLWRPGVEIATSPLTVTTGRTYSLRVVASGPRIRVYVNGGAKPVIDASDNAFASGQFGLNVYQATGTFSNLRVS
jgi:hypothetical protein